MAAQTGFNNTAAPPPTAPGVPSYPELMSGQSGWPDLNSQQPQNVAAPTTPTSPAAGDPNKAAFTNPQYGGGAVPTNIRPGDVTPGKGLTSVGGKTDLRSMLEGTFQRYGMDPNNPGSGLANIDYFLRRAQETNPNDVQYWTQRLSQEIEKATTGRVGNLIDTGGGGGGGVGGFGGGQGVGSVDFNTTWKNPYQSQVDSLYNLLMSRANQSLQVNPKDPIIASQVNAYQADAERGNRQQMSQLAEQEGPEANLAQEQRMGNEHVAQGAGTLRAQLMGNELTARRQEIAQALQEGGSLLNSQQQLALQGQLGLIDAQLRQLGIQTQNNQFLSQLGLNASEYNNWNDLVRSGMIGG